MLGRYGRCRFPPVVPKSNDGSGKESGLVTLNTERAGNSRSEIVPPTSCSTNQKDGSAPAVPEEGTTMTVKRARASANVLLVGAALGALGIVIGAGVASAAAVPPPVFSILDGNDDFINASEIAGVTVQGTYTPTATPALDRISVRVNQSATCADNATPSTGWVDVNPSGSNWSATFDLSDAAQNPDFKEGERFCAIARVWNGPDFASALGKSSNKPTKDTIVLAGSVNISDPDNLGYLNAAELAVDPTGLKGVWTANPASDGDKAHAWFAKADTTIPDVTCGPTPATISGTKSSAGSVLPPVGSSPDLALTKACGTAMPEGGLITFNALWKDVAGNVSAIATTGVGPGGSVIKDTTLPVNPLVSILGKSISGRNVINLSNVSKTDVRVTWTDLDLAWISTSINDSDAGTAALTSKRLPLDDLAPAPFTTTSWYDMSSLTDCTPNIENPNPLPPSCVKATVTLTDKAGNISGPATDVALKDTLAPLAPIVTFTPDVLDDINDSLTELDVQGEAYASVWVTVSDEDPGSPDMTNIAPLPTQPEFQLGQFSLIPNSTPPGGFNGRRVDVTPLADGKIDASVYLMDPWENRGPAGTTFATKDFTVPSLTLLSPVNGSMHAKSVEFSGLVKDAAGTGPCVGCKVTVYQRNNPNYNHPDNIAMVTLTTDATGKFKGTYKYLKSGTMKAFFKATDTVANPINGKPSAVSTFDVDSVEPGIAITTLNESVYMPGEPVIVRGGATDDFSGVLGVEVQVYPLASPEVTTTGTPGIKPNKPLYTSEQKAACPGCGSLLSKTVAWSYDLSALPSGRYTVEVFSVDRSGQKSTSRPQVSVITIR